MKQTGIHIKRANVGSVEAHNLRTKEYLDGIQKAGLPIYFFEADKHKNISWINPKYDGKSCSEIFEEMKQLYIEKIGRKPKLKDEIRLNKKTGKEYNVEGWSPIREGVIPIKEDTQIEDFNGILDWVREKGLEVIRIDLHHDEGYKNELSGEVKHNHHAHIIFDWIDHSTGKTIKLNKEDMSKFQDVVASSLEMKRGTPKKETGVKHINHTEYREQLAEKKLKETEENELNVRLAVEHLSEEVLSLLKEKKDTEFEIDNLEKKKKEGEKNLQELEEEIKDAVKRSETAILEHKILQEGISSMSNKMSVFQAEIDEMQIILTSLKEKTKDNAIHELKLFHKTAKDELGYDFWKFFSDMKKWVNNLIYAILVWLGQPITNKEHSETYTADKERCLLLINGKTQNDMKSHQTEKIIELYEKTINISGLRQANKWYEKVIMESNYHQIEAMIADMERELQEQAKTPKEQIKEQRIVIQPSRNSGLKR